MTEQKQHQNLSESPDGGYTIIESLVAMIVVSVLMIAIAPVMAFSVATRVQARRIEVATQAAKTYIDALRVGATPIPNETYVKVAGAPTAPSEIPAPANKTNLYCFKSEPTSAACGSQKDFYVQGIRSAGDNPTDTGYSLIVRVYRADAPFGSLTTGQQSVANSGIGNPKAPLVAMQTEIPPTTKGGTSAYQSLRDHTKKPSP
ncbi:type II secretion system protein [Tychonema sp. LEGE 07199]|uniref:hormogonium polysaccharide secretion pseudopilin HpsB n=1 Tax=unclassified Tychonema TaxID=2642144 RepID=UPI0018809728|nr:MULTISPECIES: hormogonium polysaccharide secretion pseudopilin HpsB [unclassified Tychonema]MBE9123850.1 type II secretion system protein [Tychonema sp. LEGE 07199]MBE9131932.1 type II secretion system protein [Tychonema sp. LEGE 07196]